MLKALKSKLPGSSSSADASEPAKAPASVSTAPADDNGEVVGAETRLKGLDAAAEQQLRSAGVDLISCAACPSPCDPLDPTLDATSIHPEKTLRAWSKQSIDFKTSMLPSTTPFYRHALISTGKKDWPHDVASVEGSLAKWFGQWAEEVAQERQEKGRSRLEDNSEGTEAVPPLPEGCWQTTLPHSARRRRQAHDGDDTAPLPGGPTRVLVSNSSHISSSRHHNGQSVMLFPDWVLLSDVCDGSGSGSGSAEEAEEAKAKTRELYRTQITAAGASTAPAPRPRRTVLPYRAVVVLCSHTKRDVRCGLAAPLLAEVLRRHAEAEGWEVDERGDDIDHHDKDDAAGPCEFDEKLEVPEGRGWGYVDEGDGTAVSPSPSEQILNWRKQLCPSSSSSASTPPPTLGIFYCSHIGKHAWAGNVIVYLPSGAGVWYGRVDPLQGAGRVFQETVLRGRVIPEYLRAGINLYRGEEGEGEEGNEVVSGTREELVGGGARARSLLRW